MATKPTLPLNPLASEATKAWTGRFAGKVRAAAKKGKTLYEAQAATIKGPYGRSAQSLFEQPSRRSISVEKAISEKAKEVAQLVRAAASRSGRKDRLSPAETRTLPAPVRDAILGLQRKNSSPKSLEAAVKATIDPLEDSGSGMSFKALTYPSTTSLADILRDLAWGDLSDEEAIAPFEFTRGTAALKDFASTIEDIGAQEEANRDQDPPPYFSKLFKDVATAAIAEFSPVSKFKSVQVATAEPDGLIFKIVIARLKNDSWRVLSYFENPF